MTKLDTGIIRHDEAYSKLTVLKRLGISQKFWDKMLDEGLPYTNVGHSRWVTGQALIEHLSRNAERKAQICSVHSQKGGTSHGETS